MGLTLDFRVLFCNSGVSPAISVSEELTLNRNHSLTNFCAFYRSYSKKVMVRLFRVSKKIIEPTMCPTFTVEYRCLYGTWNAAFTDRESCPSAAKLGCFLTGIYDV